jgi:hypothetical protein
MSKNNKKRSSERGSTLVEFSIAATVFLMVMFAVIEFGRAVWTHNALADAARRGARYAVINPEANEDNVKNVVVYGNPDGGKNPVVAGLTTDNVEVDYNGFGLDVGTAQVTIKEYKFKFVVPIIGTKIQMPKYTTTLTGESAGTTPPTL